MSFFLLSNVAHAAGAAQFAISTSLPGTASSDPTSIAGWIANFYSFALMIGGVLAFGAIVYGGIRYALARGNSSGESEAKDWIRSALYGLLLLASAYIILRTVNPALVTLALPDLAPVKTMSIVVPSAPNVVSTPLATKELSDAGVSVKPGVSIDGVRQTTLNDIAALANNCRTTEGGNCDLVITSGAGDTHAAGQCSHANGYKADIRPNGQLDRYIMSQPSTGFRSDGARLYSFGGGTIADERNLPGIAPHWDLTASCP